MLHFNVSVYARRQIYMRMLSNFYSQTLREFPDGCPYRALGLCETQYQNRCSDYFPFQKQFLVIESFFFLFKVFFSLNLLGFTVLKFSFSENEQSLFLNVSILNRGFFSNYCRRSGSRTYSAKPRKFHKTGVSR